jgi:polysaccharide export outer membrane protein
MNFSLRILVLLVVSLLAWSQPFFAQTTPQIPPNVTPEDIEQRRAELIERGIPAAKIDSVIEARRSQGIEAEDDPNVSPQPVQTDPPVLEAQEEAQQAKQEKTSQKADTLPPAKQSTGGIYGHHIFNQGVDFIRSQSILPPPEYLVGPGDVFTVTAWGSVDITEKLPVQQDGSVIYRGQFGKLYVAGLTYAQAQEAIRRRFQRLFLIGSSSIEVVMGQNRRTINVNIVGEVGKPGTYQVPASTSAFNALFVAGGIRPIGTVRNIIIKRDGKTIKTLDLYEYLIEGKEDPTYLQEDDLILVPVQKRIVSIAGSVKRPRRYELRDDEELNSLLRFAGGLTFDALLSNAQIIRVTQGKEELMDFPLGDIMEQNMDMPLFDGDRVRISDLRRGIKNLVEITGAVNYAGTYEIVEGETVADLLARAGGATDEAFLEKAYIIRIESPTELSYLQVNLRAAAASVDPAINPPLQAYDRLRVFRRDRFFKHRYIELSGPVKDPGRYEVSKDMSLKDLLYLAGGLTEQADQTYLDLYQRLELSQRAFNQKSADTSNIRRIRIDDDWQDDSRLDSIMLVSFERVRVYNKAQFIFQGEMTVKGLVNNPGTFPIRPNMTLKDLLFMAGGIKIEANFGQIELSRVIEKEDETGKITPVPIVIKYLETDQNWQSDPRLDSVNLSLFDQVFVRKNPDFELQESVFINGEVRVPGEYNKAAKDEKLSSLIQRAGGISPLADIKAAYISRPNVGRISIRLGKALRRPGSKHDISILEGDELVIPPRQDIVSIAGNVMYPGTIIQFEPGKKRLKYYVNQAGGFDEKTKRKKITVQYPDGRYKRTSGFLGIMNYPTIEEGSKIMVAAKQKKKKEKKEKDEKRERLSYQEVLAGLTSIMTLVILYEQVRNR